MLVWKTFDNEEFRNLVVVCDQCKEEYDFFLRDFHQILDEMKITGWDIQYDYKDYKHICPKCVCNN